MNTLQNFSKGLIKENPVLVLVLGMAPGPPVRMAPEAPTMLPVPTCAAMAVARAWKEVIPLAW